MQNVANNSTASDSTLSRGGRPSLEPAHVLLIGNYEPDHQQSMLRFCQLLERSFPSEEVRIEVVRPPALFGKLGGRLAGVRKWLGYIDKFVLFPFFLRRKIANCRNAIVHICDHSNALYTRFCSGTPSLVTCHDLLAVRGALGEDTDCPASSSGKVLQRWILSGLRRSSFVACDSTATREDLLRLAGPDMQCKSAVILLAQNYPYKRIDATSAWQILGTVPALGPKQPFLLHVGSDLRRKNREAILRVAAHPDSGWEGQIVFAGEALGNTARNLARELGLQDRIVEIINPTNEMLQALYNQAFALLYPSRCEGFGWPVIEANACGCPVICSDRTSLPEIAGAGAALYAPEDVEGMAKAVRSLCNPATRERWIRSGLENASRFEPERMIASYKRLYLKLAAERDGKEILKDKSVAVVKTEASPATR